MLTIEYEDDIYLYPNPASSYVYINIPNQLLNNYKEFGISLYNNVGQLVKHVEYGNSAEITSISIVDLPAGFYTAKFSNHAGLNTTQNFTIIR